MEDKSTYRSIIRVWKRIRGVRGWGGDQAVTGRDAEACSKRTNLRSKRFCISCKGRLEDSSSKNRFALAVRNGAGMYHLNHSGLTSLPPKTCISSAASG